MPALRHKYMQLIMLLRNNFGAKKKMADVAPIDLAQRCDTLKTRRVRLEKSRKEDRNKPLRKLREEEVKEKYRLKSQTLKKLARMLCAKSPKFRPSTKRSFALSPLIKVLICIRFLASGAYYHVIADTLQVSRAAVCRSIKEVVDILCSMATDVICMPSRPALVNVKAAFQAVAGLRQVIGCVDGTFARIIKPKENTHKYICRKMFPAINTQV